MCIYDKQSQCVFVMSSVRHREQRVGKHVRSANNSTLHDAVCANRINVSDRINANRLLVRDVVVANELEMKPGSVLSGTIHITGTVQDDNTVFLDTTASDVTIALADGTVIGEMRRFVLANATPGSGFVGRIRPVNGEASALISQGDCIAYVWHTTSWFRCFAELRSPADLQVFVATAAGGGTDLNDGLSQSLPVLTLKRAFAVVHEFGWDNTAHIVLAAGTHAIPFGDTPLNPGSKGCQRSHVCVRGATRTLVLSDTVASTATRALNEMVNIVGSVGVLATGAAENNLMTFTSGPSNGRTAFISRNTTAGVTTFQLASDIGIDDDSGNIPVAGNTFIVESVNAVLEAGPGFSSLALVRPVDFMDVEFRFGDGTSDFTFRESVITFIRVVFTLAAGLATFPVLRFDCQKVQSGGFFTPGVAWDGRVLGIQLFLSTERSSVSVGTTPPASVGRAFTSTFTFRNSIARGVKFDLNTLGGAMNFISFDDSKLRPTQVTNLEFVNFESFNNVGATSVPDGAANIFLLSNSPGSISVARGTVEGLGVAIFASLVRIQDTTITNSPTDGLFLRNANAQLTRVQCNLNADHGIFMVGGCSVVIRTVGGSSAQDNTYNDNTGDGIRAIASTFQIQGTVEASDNGGNGIHCIRGVSLVISDLTGTGNTGHGVRAAAASTLSADDANVGTTITGTAGDVFVGAAGTKTWADIAGGLAADVTDFGTASPFAVSVVPV